MRGLRTARIAVAPKPYPSIHLPQTGVKERTLVGSAEELLEEREGFDDEKDAKLPSLAVVNRPDLVAVKIFGEPELSYVHFSQNAAVAQQSLKPDAFGDAPVKEQTNPCPLTLSWGVAECQFGAKAAGRRCRSLFGKGRWLQAVVTHEGAICGQSQTARFAQQNSPQNVLPFPPLQTVSR